MDDFEDTWINNKNYIQESSIELQNSSELCKEKYMSLLHTKNTFNMFINLERRQLIDFANKLVHCFDRDVSNKKDLLEREQNLLRDIILDFETAQRDVAKSIYNWTPTLWMKEFSNVQMWFDKSKQNEIPKDVPPDIDFINLPSQILPRFENLTIILKGINEKAEEGKVRTEPIISSGVKVHIICEITKQNNELRFEFSLCIKNRFRVPIWDDFKVVLNHNKDSSKRFIMDYAYNSSQWKYQLSLNNQIHFSLKELSCYIWKSKMKFSLYLRQKGFYERFLDQIKYINLLEGEPSVIKDYLSIHDNFKLSNEIFQNAIYEKNPDDKNSKLRNDENWYKVDQFSKINNIKTSYPSNFSEALWSSDLDKPQSLEFKYANEGTDDHNNDNTEDTTPKNTDCVLENIHLLSILDKDWKMTKISNSSNNNENKIKNLNTVCKELNASNSETS